MKNKINKLAERNLCCDDTKNLKNEEKTLLKKQLVKAFEFEKFKKQKCWTQISVKSVFLYNYFQSQYYSWKNTIKWHLSKIFYFSNMRIQALKKKQNEWKQVKKVFTNIIYKKKTDKIKFFDLSDCISEKSEENIEWWDVL